MAALIEHLRHMLARGDSELDVVRAIEEELTGGDLLDDELSDGRAAIWRALQDESELQSRFTRAAAAMPANDERRVELLRTLTFAHRGGIFLPNELQVREGERGLTWAAAEAVRFSAFAVVVGEVVRRMEQHRIRPEDYASAVTELASRLARVRVGGPTVRR